MSAPIEKSTFDNACSFLWYSADAELRNIIDFSWT